MEPFFIFCCILVVFCGYMTCIDMLKEEKEVLARAVTELKVLERSGKMVFVLIRRHIATGEPHEVAMHAHLQHTSRVGV